MRRADHLHHWGDKGIGQKGSDHEVARVCEACHRREQGKRRIAYMRRDEFEKMEIFVKDALDLLSEYVSERNEVMLCQKRAQVF